MSHYSLAQKPHELSKWAERAAKYLTEKTSVRDAYPVLIFRGYSGVATSTALMLALYKNHGIEPGVMYVRKPEEKSHGSHIEYNKPTLPAKKRVAVFVDDFVSLGNTLVALIGGARTRGLQVSDDSLLLLTSDSIGSSGSRWYFGTIRTFLNRRDTHKIAVDRISLALRQENVEDGED